MEVEIFVVDNHSQDDSLDYLIPRFPEVRFIANTENVGFARANNQAIEQSTGKYVLLLNPDTVIAENTLFEVFQFMEAHPEAGGTGVKMLDGDGRFLPESKRGFPTPWVSFCKIFGLSALFPHSRIFGRYHMKYLSPDECHPLSRITLVIGTTGVFLSGVELLIDRYFLGRWQPGWSLVVLTVRRCTG